MRTIWKLELDTDDSQLLALPKDAKILSVQTQYGRPCLWFSFDPANQHDLKPRKILFIGTGHKFEVEGYYIGTIQLYQGSLIFHVYEEK